MDYFDEKPKICRYGCERQRDLEKPIKKKGKKKKIKSKNNYNGSQYSKPRFANHFSSNY